MAVTLVVKVSQRRTVKTVAPGTVWRTPLYVIESTRPGPTVWIIGGTHGNEPAGYRAASIVKNYRIARGRLVVLQCANRLAVLARRHYVPSTGDLNRAYPRTPGSRPRSTLARSIWAYMKKYRPAWLLDLHEGTGYHYLTHHAVGQTAIVYPNSETERIIRLAITKLNTEIPGKTRDFSILRWPALGSHARASGQLLHAHAVTFETSVREPFLVRIKQQLALVNTILSHLKMR